MSVRRNHRIEDPCAKIMQSSDKQVWQSNRDLGFKRALEKKAMSKPIPSVKKLKSPVKTPRLQHKTLDQKAPIPIEGSENSMARLRFDEELNHNSCKNFEALEKLIEKDPSVVVQASIGSGRVDDINLLIKKLTLNFAVTNREAKFSIPNGIFAGAHFALVTDNRNLTVKVCDASFRAKALLEENHLVLKNLLEKQEIILRDIRFIS